MFSRRRQLTIMKWRFLAGEKRRRDANRRRKAGAAITEGGSGDSKVEQATGFEKKDKEGSLRKWLNGERHLGTTWREKEIVILPNSIHQMQYTEYTEYNLQLTTLKNDMHSYEPNTKKEQPWQVAKI